MGREIGYVRVHAHFSFINPLSHAFENVTKRIFAVTFRLASFSFWRNYIFIDLHRFGQVKLRLYFVNCFYLSHVLQFYFRLNPDGGLFTFSLQRSCRKSIYLFNGDRPCCRARKYCTIFEFAGECRPGWKNHLKKSESRPLFADR